MKGIDMASQAPLNAPQLSGKTPSKAETDPRLDPRIKKFCAAMPAPVEKPNVSSREELLAQENSPSAGLTVSVETLTSSPDGNTIKIRYVRSDNSEILPCVYYIHGGRMEMSS
jgi:acetyl esterase/lipase